LWTALTFATLQTWASAEKIQGIAKPFWWPF